MISKSNILSLVVSLLVLGLLTVFLRRTILGSALRAAADDFVACCEGSTDDAFDVLEVYARLSGDQPGSTACVHRAERAQDARIVPR